MKISDAISLAVKNGWEKMFDEEFVDGNMIGNNRNRIKSRIKSLLSRQRSDLVEMIGKMSVEKDEAMFEDDPDKKLAEGYAIGYNQALTDAQERIDNLNL